jgi:hypothetical protein
MTIDIKALIGAFAQDTNAIGVVKVEVREAIRDGSVKLQGRCVKHVVAWLTKLFFFFLKKKYLFRYGRFLCKFVFEHSAQEKLFEYSRIN